MIRNYKPISANPATIDRARTRPTDKVVLGSLLGGAGAKKRRKQIYMHRIYTRINNKNLRK